MSWISDIADPTALRERTMKSLTVPIGLANPLWLAFGAAASAGAAWWLMTRWANPLNAEAMFGAAFKTAPKAAPEKTPARKAVKAVENAPEPTPETTPVVLQVALEVAPAVVEAVAAPVETALEVVQAEAAALSEAVTEALADTEAETEEVADDFTRLVGIGPRTAAALAERGVTRFAQLAAWTEDQLAAFDAELSLKGRSVRDKWRAQAKRLAAEA
jgi:predicted flap endonuclease-1-like 5' DNA nuclease